jgi:hypothetical protein
MVTTILPMVHGDRTNNKNMLLILPMHAVGSAMGSAVTGVFVGWMSTVATRYIRTPAHQHNLVLVCILMAGSLREAKVASFQLLQSTWQVPRHWTRNGMTIWTSFRYGFCLGTGVMTRLTSAFYILVLSLLLIPVSRIDSVVIMIAFGVSRAIPLWSLWRYYRNEGHFAELAVNVGRLGDVVGAYNAIVFASLAGMFIAKAFFH